MKKIISLVLIVTMCCVAFISCGNNTKGNDTKNHTSFKILEDDFGAEEYAVAFRKEDTNLMLTIQAVLDDIYTDGTGKEISEKWFDKDLILTDNDYPSEVVETENDNSMQDVLNKGKLVVGFDADFPPMSYTDGETGEIAGFDIDIAKEVCERLQIELELCPIDWDTVDEEMSAKKIDVIWSGFSIDPERIAAYNLSKPYLSSRQIIIVPDGSDITDKAGLKGKKIGLRKGSTVYKAIKADAISDSIGEIVEYADNSSAFAALKEGSIDAFVVDYSFGKYVIEAQSEAPKK